MKINFLILFLIVISTFSCLSPRLTNIKRGKYRTDFTYKDVIDRPKIEDIFQVSVSVLPLPAPPSPTQERPKTFFDLRDSIPHVYLKIIGEKTGDSIPPFLEAIKAELSKTEKKKTGASKGDNNLDKITIRLLLSNVKKFYNDKHLQHENTRLDYLHTTVSIRGTKFKIYTIDKLENEFETIDLGTLTRKAEITFETGLSGEIGNESSVTSSTSENSNSDFLDSDTNTITLFDSDGNPVKVMANTSKANTTGEKSNNSDIKAGTKAAAKAEMKLISKQSLEESANLKQKRIKTSFSFDQSSFTVSQRGAVLRDISDNIFVTVTLIPDKSAKITKPNSFSTFKDLYVSGKINRPEAVELSLETKHYFPCNENSLVLESDFEGVIRSVKNTSFFNNFGEFDDKVVYFPIVGKSDPIILDLDDFCSRVYEFVMKSGQNEYTLYNNGSKVYMDSQMATDFLIWFYEAVNSKDLSFFNKNLKNGSVYSFELHNSSANKIPLFSDKFDITEMNKFLESSFRVRPIN